MSLSTLLIVDDDPGVREVLRELVELCCPEITIVGEGTNGREAVDLAQTLAPDIILIDIRMPILDGIEATQIMKNELCVEAVVITFTSCEWPDLEQRAHQAGARYHLYKPFALEDLQKTLREAAGSSGY